MRKLFRKVAKVLGVERFAYMKPMHDGEAIGILLDTDEAKGVKRGDIVYIARQPRSLLRRTVKVLGVEKYFVGPSDSQTEYTTVLFNSDEVKGIKRGDFIIGGRV